MMFSMKRRLFVAIVLLAIFSVSVYAQDGSARRGNFFFSGSYSRVFIPEDRPIQILPDLQILELNFAKIAVSYEMPLGPGRFTFGLETGFCSSYRFGEGRGGNFDFIPLNLIASYVFPLARVLYMGPSFKFGGLGMLGPEWSSMALMGGVRLEAELRTVNFPFGVFVAGGVDFFPNAIENGVVPVLDVGLRFPRGRLVMPERRERDEDAAIEASTDLELRLTTEPAAKLALSQSFVFPFLQGESPFTRENNLSTVITAEVSPVSLNGIAELNLTPVAFFTVSGGGQAGSGWNIPIADGIGINRPENVNAARPRRAIIDGNGFDGLIWSTWGAGTLQFDLGAVVPGDWNHVLFQTRHEFRYSAYTRAGPGDSWIFENDDGENQNGWAYHATYIVGYHMPSSPVLSTVALMAELRRPLYNTEGGSFWGEYLGYWIFSSVFDFTITPRLSTTFALQMHTRRNHGTSNFDNAGYFYRDFALQDDGGWRRLMFHRAALVLRYKIR